MRTFKRVVLALPFTRLRAVKGLGGLGLPADKMKVINEQGYGAVSTAGLAAAFGLSGHLAPTPEGSILVARRLGAGT